MKPRSGRRSNSQLMMLSEMGFEPVSK